MNNINTFIESPLFQYLVSPMVIAGMVVLMIKKIFQLGTLAQKFNQTIEDIDELRKDVKHLIHDMSVIKTHLIEKKELDSRLFKSS